MGVFAGEEYAHASDVVFRISESAERNALLDAFEHDARDFGLTMLWERKDMDFCLKVLRGEEDPGYWWAG